MSLPNVGPSVRLPRKAKKELRKSIPTATPEPPIDINRHKTARPQPTERKYRPTETAQPKSPRISRDILVAKLAHRLQFEFNKLYALIQSDEPYPESILEELVFATLELSPARYKGYKVAELRVIVRDTIALVRSRKETKALTVRSNPAKKQAPTPAPTVPTLLGTTSTKQQDDPTEPLRQLLVQSVLTTPSTPTNDTAVSRTTRPKGRPKRVSTSQTIDDVQVIMEKLDERFKNDPELKDACESNSIDRNDPRIQEDLDALVRDGILAKPGSLNRSFKAALQGLRESAHQDASAQPTARRSVVPVSASAKSKPEPDTANGAATSTETLQNAPLSAKHQAMFRRFDRQQAVDQAEQAAQSQARLEKEARFLERSKEPDTSG